MYTLYTNGQPWLDKDGNILKFDDMEQAHRYAERVDERIYIDSPVGNLELGLFIQGEMDKPPKYVIRRI